VCRLMAHKVQSRERGSRLRKVLTEFCRTRNGCVALMSGMLGEQQHKRSDANGAAIERINAALLPTTFG